MAAMDRATDDSLDPNRPDRYPRRVLLAVTGLSPQVVTETLYALAVKQQPAFVPTEILLITTRAGAQHARLNLLSAEPGWFHRLRRDYDLPAIDFDDGRILVIPDAAGAPAEDIRTPEDNARAADFIAETVRKLTQDPASALHVSLAGGRKTMGYYLGYALSLFGRPQDRLSHVLVSPPFESHPEFYYPTPGERIIHSLDKAQTPMDCRQAEVTLAEIPFVSLRHGLAERLQDGTLGFSEAVAAARAALEPPRLRIDLKGLRIQAGAAVIELTPAELALYSLFARRALAGEPALPAPPKEAGDSDWAERFMREYRGVRHEMDDLNRTTKALKKGMDGDYFSSHKSRLHKKLKKHLGKLNPYLIDDGGTRPRRYALRLPPEAITYGAIESS